MMHHPFLKSNTPNVRALLARSICFATQTQLCSFAAFAIFVLVSGAGNQTVLAQRGEGPTQVVAGNVIKTSRSSMQSFVGTLTATKRTTVGSAVDGRVTKVDFDAGDPVGADATTVNSAASPASELFVGQSLVEIRTDTLDIEIKSAELQQQLAQQTFEELKVSLPQNIELANSNLLGAEAQLDYANANYQRLRNLQKNSGAISTLEVELARSQYRAAQQAVISSKVEQRRLTTTRDLQLAQSQSSVDSAKQDTLRLRDLRAQYTIRAPFKGVVTQKMTEVGEWVTRGSPIVEIVQLDPIEMIVNIPQEYSGRLQESLEQANQTKSLLPVAIEVNGIGGKFTGELVRVIPQADLRSRSFPVRIRIANPPTGDTFKLKPGMLGRAKLLVGREVEMVLVKKDALVLGSGGNKVFKVIKSGEKKTAVPVVVEIGAEIGSWVQVTGNLTEKDTVVIFGNERLRPGAEIVVSETRTQELDE